MSLASFGDDEVGIVVPAQSPKIRNQATSSISLGCLASSRPRPAGQPEDLAQGAGTLGRGSFRIRAVTPETGRETFSPGSRPVRFRLRSPCATTPGIRKRSAAS